MSCGASGPAEIANTNWTLGRSCFERGYCACLSILDNLEYLLLKESESSVAPRGLDEQGERLRRRKQGSTVKMRGSAVSHAWDRATHRFQGRKLVAPPDVFADVSPQLLLIHFPYYLFSFRRQAHRGARVQTPGSERRRSSEAKRPEHRCGLDGTGLPLLAVQS